MIYVRLSIFKQNFSENNCPQYVHFVLLTNYQLVG